MILIKKYANRRLYDTSNSSYITLPECADIIRTGKQVQIIDAKTKQDITAIVMIQIIMECEQQSPILPVDALRHIIKAYASQSGRLLGQHLEHATSSFAHHHLDKNDMADAGVDADKPANISGLSQRSQPDTLADTKRELLEQLRDEMIALSKRIKQL